jgi:hypothetical protein
MAAGAFSAERKRTMKTLSVITICSLNLCLSFLPSPGRAAQDEAGALKEQLVQLEKQSWKAWQNHDGKFFEGFLSGDHVELGFGGASNKKEVVAGVASGECEVKKYSLDSFEMRMLGSEAAILTYHESQDATCHGKTVPSPCWVSSLYMKRGGTLAECVLSANPGEKVGG